MNTYEQKIIDKFITSVEKTLNTKLRPEIIKEMKDNFLKDFNSVDISNYLAEKYVAVKLWSKEDIATILEKEGYEGNSENIQKVIDSGELKNLEDCTDSEWNVIYDVVDKVMNSKNLESNWNEERE